MRAVRKAAFLLFLRYAGVLLRLLLPVRLSIDRYLLADTDGPLPLLCSRLSLRERCLKLRIASEPGYSISRFLFFHSADELMREARLLA